jgi:hypothetical protein
LSSVARHFGSTFFGVHSVPRQFSHPISQYVHELGIDEAEKESILVEIGMGGILVKTIGIVLGGRGQSCAFWSMPAIEASDSGHFDFDEKDAV